MRHAGLVALSLALANLGAIRALGAPFNCTAMSAFHDTQSGYVLLCGGDCPPNDANNTWLCRSTTFSVPPAQGGGTVTVCACQHWYDSDPNDEHPPVEVGAGINDVADAPCRLIIREIPDPGIPGSSTINLGCVTVNCANTCPAPVEVFNPLEEDPYFVCVCP
ncbi:MAG: hypothetical protein HMLKMBBP_00565 [Planctomycetes bacterium]|nr:hypothetical protein [Planctomycetota bacterium]